MVNFLAIFNLLSHFRLFIIFDLNIELYPHTFLTQTDFSGQATYIRRSAMIILRWKNLNFLKRPFKFRAIITFPTHFSVCVRLPRPVQLATKTDRITLLSIAINRQLVYRRGDSYSIYFAPEHHI